MEEKIGEFIGIMLGDGSIGIYDKKDRNKGFHYVVKVTLDSRNKGYTDHVVNLMKEVLRFEPRIHYKRGDNYKRPENTVDIRVYRKEAVVYVMEKLGLKKSPKWERMEIPEKFCKGKLALPVMKGLFDTDGHLSIFNNNGIEYPRIEIRLCPSPAQAQCSKILDEFGFKYRIQDLERGKTRIRISGKDQLRKWYELIGSSNPIHIEKFKLF